MLKVNEEKVLKAQEANDKSLTRETPRFTADFPSETMGTTGCEMIHSKSSKKLSTKNPISNKTIF